MGDLKLYKQPSSPAPVIRITTFANQLQHHLVVVFCVFFVGEGICPPKLASPYSQPHRYLLMFNLSALTCLLLRFVFLFFPMHHHISRRNSSYVTQHPPAHVYMSLEYN